MENNHAYTFYVSPTTYDTGTQAEQVSDQDIPSSQPENITSRVPEGYFTVADNKYLLKHKAFMELSASEEKIAMLLSVGRAESYIEVVHWYRQSLRRWHKQYIIPYGPVYLKGRPPKGETLKELDDYADLAGYPFHIKSWWLRRYEVAIDPVYCFRYFEPKK